MKLFEAVSAVLIAITVLYKEIQLRIEWSEFKALYNKNYKNLTEEAKRYTIICTKIYVLKF